MTDTTSGLPLTSSRAEEIFPILTLAQIRRIAAHGHMRAIQRGEVLVEQGDSAVPFFVVVSGEIEIVRPLGAAETLITVHRPGQFTGEVNMLSGRRALFRMRVTKPGEVIELDHQQMLALVQTDAELGEIVMRAFLLRRVELVAAGMGDAVLVGSTHSAGTLQIKEFLMRNGYPYSYIDLERDPDVQNLLDVFHIAASEIPVVICRGQLVLRNPTNQQVADGLGFNEAVDQTHLRDLIIVGAGPSDWQQPFTALQKGLTFWYWRRVHRVVRQVQVQKLKTTWGSQPVSRARNSQLGHTARRRSSAPRSLSPRARDSLPTASHMSSKWRTGLEFRHARS